MAHAQFFYLIFRDVVVHVVKKAQILSNDCDSHFLELALKWCQVDHNDLNASTEENSLIAAFLCPLPSIILISFSLFLLAILNRRHCGCDLDHKEPALAREKLSDHLPTSNRMIVAVESGAKLGDGNQQLFDVILDVPGNLIIGDPYPIEIGKDGLDCIPQFLIDLILGNGLIPQICVIEIPEQLLNIVDGCLGHCLSR